MTAYDDWIFTQPNEIYFTDPEYCACEVCEGTGEAHPPDGTSQDCENCDGTGEVLIEHDEPDEDYLYEQQRDRMMEDQF